jgi:hypothetical protein
VETPRKFITAKLTTHHIINTDEDPGLRIQSFAVINSRGVSTNKKYYKSVINSECKNVKN